MGAGILPVAYYRKTLFFLLGQERYLKSWSDFGGGSHKGEIPIDTAVREGYEEVNGLLGSQDELKEKVDDNMILSLCYDKYTSYLFRTKYNKDLPTMFENTNQFAEVYLQDKIMQNHNGLFEKSQIKWYSLDELQSSLDLMRNHYKEIVKSIIKNKKLIIKQLEKLDSLSVVY